MAISNNDPFEEFEFKPINEGLGFHRKQKKTNIATKTTHTNQVRFQSPLPRPDSLLVDQVEAKTETRQQTRRSQTVEVLQIEDDSISKAQTAVNEILKNLNQKRQLDFAEENEKKKIEYKKSKPQFFAAVLDGMLITAAFLLSLIVMLTITKVDLFMNLAKPQDSKSIYLATLGLFLSVHFIYMVVNRAFAGYTPGEWAFDQVCGKQNQEEETTYIPKIILRSILITCTGFIILPMLSYLFNKDIAGEISGVSLFKKPYV